MSHMNVYYRKRPYFNKPYFLKWLDYLKIIYSQKYIDTKFIDTKIILNLPTDFIIAESKDRHQRHCRLCKQPFSGRADKIFFSATCKANYHIKLNKVTMDVSERIDKILHRNRSTLI